MWKNTIVKILILMSLAKTSPGNSNTKRLSKLSHAHSSSNQQHRSKRRLSSALRKSDPDTATVRETTPSNSEPTNCCRPHATLRSSLPSRAALSPCLIPLHSSYPRIRKIKNQCGCTVAAGQEPSMSTHDTRCREGEKRNEKSPS